MPYSAGRISLSKMLLHAAVVLALSMAATLAAWRWTSQQGEVLETTRFNQYADEAVNELRERMEGYNQLLLSGVALFDASDAVGREEWRRFFGRLDVGRLYPGTQGVGFAQRVEAGQWGAHEARVRAEGFPEYRIVPPGVRALSFPIVYLEPFSGRNLRAFGFDMFSEPVRHEAMARARDGGNAALTGKVVLVQETDRDVQPGVLLYLPSYVGNPQGVEDRRDTIRGFVYSPLRMGDLVRGVMGDRLSRLCVELYDHAPEPGNQLFASQDCRAGHYASEARFEVFGRQWVMRVRSTPALDDEIANRRSKLILGAGSIISLLVVWAVLSMLAERRRRVALDRALGQLEAARAEAAGALAAKGRFMAAASHDLRQPLQSLGLFLQLMVERSPKLGAVERAAQQAYDATSRLVEAMFDAAALESGRAKPVVEPVEVAHLVEAIAAEHQAEAARRGLSLRVRVCPEVVETDKVMLERIIRNLVSNALKYTHSGGVLIACRATDSLVRIKVADSGPGIPEDKRDLIFEDFYQIENPERDPRKGLGLGLATVSRMARALGFRLYVLSREGMGSTFVIELPRATARQQSSRPAA
jgi:signal transduction histidine kinase